MAPRGISRIPHSISALFHRVSSDSNDFLQFVLSDDTDLNNAASFGDMFQGTPDDFNARVRLSSDVNANPTTGVTVTTGTTYLLVGRLSKDGPSSVDDRFDRMELWVNPTSLTPGTAHATANGSLGIDGGLDTLFFRTVGLSSTDVYLLDEIRLADTFADVVGVPEPAMPAMLLGSLGVAYLAGRRRGRRF